MDFEPLSSIRREFQRYKSLAEDALLQLRDDELNRAPTEGLNSASTLVWHISGNLESRFTDFLTADGEKPWRKRDAEFDVREAGRDEVWKKWEKGWAALESSLDGLGSEDMEKLVSVRGEPYSVVAALHRSLAHTAYHVGQIVMIGRSFRGADWQYLSIPPGASDEFNRRLGFRP
jgi:uncharacterized damage-inducible protein DinB